MNESPLIKFFSFSDLFPTGKMTWTYDPAHFRPLEVDEPIIVDEAERDAIEDEQ